MRGNTYRKKGSATVFLLLVFIIIMTLIVTLVTVLSYHSENVNAARTLNLSLESSFSRYYSPLFEDYRMFYLIETDKEALQADIMTCFMENQEYVTRLLRIEPSGLSVEGKYYATDNGAENVMSQIAAQVKYSLADESVRKLFRRINDSADRAAESENQINAVYTEVEDCEDAAELESDVLELLRLVEGITVSGDDITCAECYVKQGLTGDINPVNAGIDSDRIWSAVKDNDWDITRMLGRLLDISSTKTTAGSDYPGNDIAVWKDRLEMIKQKTEKALRLSQDISKGLAQAGRNGCICDVSSFCTMLEENIPILEALLKLADSPLPDSREENKAYHNRIKACIRGLDGYHVSDLYFDYGTLVSEEVENPLENDPGNAKGLLKLIIAEERNVSGKSVNEACVYESIVTDNVKQDGKPDVADKTYDSDNGQVPGNYDSSRLKDFLDDCRSSLTVDSAGESIMLNTYIELFLKGYTDYAANDNHDAGKHALSYEKEYVTSGKTSDHDNLEATVMKIQMIRAAEAFIYLVSNKKLSGEAYAVASALVGFTGMDALVRCVKYLILAVWAYEDACVDTGALLQGKDVPLVRKCVNISLAEMPGFGRKLIQQKIQKLKGSKGVDYDFYLQLFMAATSRHKRLCRSMDIIQMNMKLRHDRRFSFQSALYGADVNLVCVKPFYGEFCGRYRYR